MQLGSYAVISMKTLLAFLLKERFRPKDDRTLAVWLCIIGMLGSGIIMILCS